MTLGLVPNVWDSCKGFAQRESPSPRAARVFAEVDCALVSPSLIPNPASSPVCLLLEMPSVIILP